MIPTDELRELLAKVTPGEWHVVPTEYGWRVGYPRPGNEARIDSLTSESLPEAESNCRIMAIAPSLAAEVLRLREMVEKAKGEIVHAYLAGAQDVQACWIAGKAVMDDDADFTEAAYDYATEALATLTQADERESGAA